ncbi:hypothetical protein SLA2020_146420 [Shorea laevis]
MKLLFRVGQEQELELPRWERVYQRMVKLRSLPCNIGLKGLIHDIDLDIIYTSIYYDKWLNSQSKEPFFYWLDIREGKEVNLEACPKSKLQQQCIKLVVEGGALEAVWPQSSRYRTTPKNFKDFISFLEEYNMHLTDVKMRAANEEEGSIANQRSSKHLRCSSFEEDLDQTLKSLDTKEIVKDLVQGGTDSVEETTVALEHPKSRRLCNLSGDLTYLEIPKRDESFGSLQNDHLTLGQSCNDNSMDSPVEDSHRTSKEAFATQL